MQSMNLSTSLPISSLGRISTGTHITLLLSSGKPYLLCRSRISFHLLRGNGGQAEEGTCDLEFILFFALGWLVETPNFNLACTQLQLRP